MISKLYTNYSVLPIVEAEYVKQCNKPIIPLMMQRDYKPQGWLGILVGMAYYVSFDGKFTFDRACEDLVKQLNNRGKSHENEGGA